MDITRSKCCRRLTFVNVASCPHCGKAFSPGTLQSKALAEDKEFNKKINALFLAVLVALAAMSIFIFSQYPAKPTAASYPDHVLKSLR